MEKEVKIEDIKIENQVENLSLELNEEDLDNVTGGAADSGGYPADFMSSSFGTPPK